MYGELVPVLVQQLLLSALVTRHAHGPAPALALLACSAALLALLLATRPTSLLWGLNLPVAVTALLSKVSIFTSAVKRSIGEVLQSWRRPLLGPSPG